MPQTLPNGITTPINADAYNLAPDLATLGNSANVIIPVANNTARDALTPVAGMCVLRFDTGAVEAYLSGAWTPITGQGGANPFMVHAGSTTVNVGVGNPSGTASVTFTTAFTQAPIITTTMSANVGNNAYKLVPHTYNKTTTGFTLDLKTTDGTGSSASYALPVDWIAIQMTPTTAAG